MYTNELFTKQKYTQRTNLWLPGGRGNLEVSRVHMTI